MIRPAPLKLKYDNRFPLPLLSAPKPQKKESFFQVLYKANWKNVVIAVAGLNALRFAFATFNAFQDARVDKFEHQPRLVTVSIALCVMYSISCVIEIFGVIGIFSRRLALVRAYIFVEFASALLMTTASILGATSFFSNAEDLMYECVALAITGQTYSKTQFRGGQWPNPLYRLGLRQAQKRCVAAWTHESWTQVMNVFIFGFMPALMCYILAYIYYRQTTDATHHAYLVPRQRISGSAVPQDKNGGYSRVTNDDVPFVEETQKNRVAPMGNPRSARLRAGRRSATKAPNNARTSSTTSRSLKRAHRPPALLELEGPIFTSQKGPSLQSGSPLSFIFSPGIPSFGVNIVGPSRLGIGAYGPAANLSCSSASLLSAGFSKFV